MGCTVKQLAGMSGVTVRTLHFCKDLVTLMGRELPADSRKVQEVIRRHHQWLKQFWTPTRAPYAGHSQLIVDSELRKAYEAHDPRLPEFAAAAIKVFAEKELS